MVNEKKNEVAKVETTAMGAMSAMSEFAEFAGAGAENITAKDIKLPYLKIVEGGSDYVKQGTESYIDEAKIGDIINSSTKELFTNKKGGALIIPVMTVKLWTEWIPKTSAESTGRPISYRLTSDGAKEVEVSNDRGQKKKVMKLPNGNDLIETQYFYVILINNDGTASPAMISMSSTRLSSAREFVTCIYNYTQKGLPTFAALINLKTSLKQKNNDCWNIFSIHKVKEHELLNDEFLDIRIVDGKPVNPKARELFDLAVAQFKIIQADKDFFISAATSDVIETTASVGSGTTSEEAKNIL